MEKGGVYCGRKRALKDFGGCFQAWMMAGGCFLFGCGVNRAWFRAINLGQSIPF